MALWSPRDLFLYPRIPEGSQGFFGDFAIPRCLPELGSLYSASLED